MKKHLFSSLGLALLLMAWGGANTTAEAAVTYTKVSEVNFNNDQANYIPAGWTVVHDGTSRAGGTDCSSTRGSRLFDFTNSVQSFSRALYLGVSWNEDASSIKESYALYGDQEGYSLTLPEGQVELRIPAFLWKNGGSTNLWVRLTKSTDTSFENPIINEKKGMTYNVAGSQSDDLSGIHILKFQLDITATDAGTYLLKVGPETVGNSEVMIGGFSVYTYEGTPSKYDDESMVFEETFATTSDNCAPVEGSGWVLRDVKGNAERTKTPGAGYSGDGIRIFKLSCSDKLSSAFYCNGSTSTATYGEGTNGESEKLYLEAGEYFISYYAAAWKLTWDSKMPSETFKILSSEGTAIVNHSQQLTVNCNGSKTEAITPDHIQFVVNVETEGYYTLVLSSTGETFVGSISIRKNSNLTPISLSFTTGNTTPAAGSGWTLYGDNGTQISNGTNPTSGARVLDLGMTSGLKYGVYCGWDGTGSLKYGEEDELPLTLVGGKEYRLAYFALRWETSYTPISCSISGANPEDELSAPLSRTDALSGLAMTGPVADYIETTFVPKATGNYILKFSGKRIAVGNITLAENYKDPIVYTATLDANVGYSTLYVDRAVAIPSDVKVYVAAISEDDESTVELTELTDNIPANTAVIIEGTPGATVTFKPATAPADAVESNVLDGVLVGTTLPTDKSYYTLAYTLDSDGKAQNVGFYKSSANALRANKAYIALSPASSISTLRIKFDTTEEPGNVTAIEQVKAEAPAARAIFDLRGRRVADMNKPGLYVVDGHKVLVK